MYLLYTSHYKHQFKCKFMVIQEKNLSKLGVSQHGLLKTLGKDRDKSKKLEPVGNSDVDRLLVSDRGQDTHITNVANISFKSRKQLPKYSDEKGKHKHTRDLQLETNPKIKKKKEVFIDEPKTTAVQNIFTKHEHTQKKVPRHRLPFI